MKQLFLSFFILLVGLQTGFSQMTSHGELNIQLRHSLDFFIENAWDEETGSFASQVDFNGKIINDERSLMAMSRMIYGLAEGASIDSKYLSYAHQSAKFIFDHMLEKDESGRLYFVSKVNRLGQPTLAVDELIVNEQAYGLNGLVRLYQVTQSPSLLAVIEKAYADFFYRFYDPLHGGFFESYNLKTKRVNPLKSYNSTVYVATSFLIELAGEETANSAQYKKILFELGDIVATKFMDKNNDFIIENFSRDWRASWRNWQSQTLNGENYTIGVVGHNFQAAWFLLRLSEMKSATAAQRTSYQEAAKEILSKILDSGAVDLQYGGVFDVFIRETNQKMWHNNKAWWQQLEAILALSYAQKLNLFDYTTRTRVLLDKALTKTLFFYIRHFIDSTDGGEYAVVTRQGEPISTEFKGHNGKSTYHVAEYVRYLKEYLMK